MSNERGEGFFGSVLHDKRDVIKLALAKAYVDGLVARMEGSKLEFPDKYAERVYQELEKELRTAPW